MLCPIKKTMKQLALILTIIFLLISCDFKTTQDYLNEAEKLSEQGKYKEAIELLDKAIDKDQKYLGAYINRGANKSSLKNYEEAIRDYRIVLDLDPKNTLALYNVGNNYKRLENYKTAINFYNKAFDTKGGQSHYLDLSTSDLVSVGEFDVPGHEIHFERGIAYYEVDSLQRAVNDFNAAIQKNYMTAECHYWLGLIYLSSGQTDLACKNLKKSKELGDKDAEAELRKYCNNYEKHRG
jgi:tetratricopeptide (TPR) repeat protein